MVSFELFPPKTDEGERNLLEKALPQLAALRPDYISVTYGAGGSTQGRTLKIIDAVRNRQNITTVAHLTCVNATRLQIAQVLQQIRGLGVSNILALRGDPPGNAGDFVKTDGGFEYAHELVTFLRELGGYSIGVAGFPEGHLACKAGKLADWDHLARKVGCGADFVLTQLFFDNRDFLAMRDHLVRRGVKVPIIPGIIPILSTTQIQKFTALCGAALPGPLKADLEKVAGDEEAALQYGIEYATQQCAELLKAGVPGFHFYVLNKARSTAAILKNLGLR